MFLQNISLKLAMDEIWYKEYFTFLLAHLCSAIACWLIPVFQSEQGLSAMAVVPLPAAISYGHTLSPRRPCYGNFWKNKMAYHKFILATLKKHILFAIPAGIMSWALTFALEGFAKELTIMFETAVWGLTSGICLCAMVYYIEETHKLRKVNEKAYRENLKHLWSWIIPSMVAFAILITVRMFVFLDLTLER